MADTAPRVRLTRLSGARSGEAIELAGAAVRIGSSQFSDVKFDATETPHIAQVHAKIVFSQGTHWLYDNEGDEVATLVNGEKISRVELRPADVLQFGEKGPRLRFEPVVEKPPVATPSVPMTPMVPLIQGELTQQLSPSPGSLLPPAEEELDLDRTIQIAPKKKTGQTPIPSLALRASKEYSLEAATITIGRKRGNDIVLDHPQISSLHAQIVKEGAKHVLVDRGSANGTFVGTERVTRKVLAAEDMIHIGPYTLLYSGGKIHAFGEQSASTIDIVHVDKTVAGNLKLLDDVTLRIEAGELVGLLGPSGAGKSTLLGVLNGQRRATKGRVLVNGLDLIQNYDSLKSFMGFVPQDDIIHTELNPERTLHYVSLLRLPSDSTRDERQARIDEVVQLLELSERRKIPIHRLSGGQRKRVSIGVELMTEPQLIYLDEPTAGLDPALESKMMVLFKELASRGKTVLVTTHVMENVHLFDKLLVMMKGKLIFYGSPAETLAHFGISDMRHLYAKLATAEPDEWRKRFATTAQHQKHVKTVDAHVKTTSSDVSKAVLRRRTSILAPFRQLSILARRQLEILLRDKKNTTLLLLQAPIVAFFIALAMDSPALITFMLALSSIWFGTTNAAKEIVKELPIYRRERMVNLGILPYIASKALVLGLLAVIQCGLLVAVVNTFRHVPGDPLWIYGTLLLSSISGVLTGLAISAFVDTTDKATALVPLLLIPQVLFAGVFTPLTGLSGHVGRAMPTRWSYDLLKRVVMVSHKEKTPPLIDFEEKNKAEQELLAAEAHSRSAVAQIDSQSSIVADAVARIDSTRHAMNASVGRLGEHEKAARDGYERSRVLMAAIEKETGRIAAEIKRQEKAARELREDLDRLAGAKPEAMRDLLTPEWVADRRDKLVDAGESYLQIETAIAHIDSSKKLLTLERVKLEERIKDAKNVEAELKDGKERLERDGSVLVGVGASVRELEQSIKKDADRIHEVQATVTENLKLRKYVPLHPRDSIPIDAAALAGFCGLFAVATLALQKLRDREA